MLYENETSNESWSSPIQSKTALHGHVVFANVEDALELGQRDARRHAASELGLGLSGLGGHEPCVGS